MQTRCQIFDSKFRPYSIALLPSTGQIQAVHRFCATFGTCSAFARSDIWNTSEALSSTNGHWTEFFRGDFCSMAIGFSETRAPFFVLLYSFQLSIMVEYLDSAHHSCRVCPTCRDKRPGIDDHTKKARRVNMADLCSASLRDLRLYLVELTWLC